MLMKKIYLSKPGIICASGSSLSEFWKNITEGNQASIKKADGDFSGRTFYTAQVSVPLPKPVSVRYDSRAIRLIDFALNQIAPDVEKAVSLYGAERTGVCVGTCDNGSELSYEAHKKFFTENHFPENYNMEMQSAHYNSSFIKEKFSLKGPALAFTTACSSGAAAVIQGARLIKAGVCDAVIAGGSDVASDTVLLGFDSLEAVSSSKTNPFSKNRDGITLGEGAAFFVLSKDPLDENRILLEGYGESSDAYHMTSPDPSGDGAYDAMKKALESAGLSAEDIGYLNLHGTGTHLNDSMEAAAVDRLFASYKVPCSSTKCMTGHTLGAAAAVELAACYEAVVMNRSKEDALLPVQIWDGEKDEELPQLNFVSKDSAVFKNHKVQHCMSSSFAFGGNNACLIIGEE